MKAPKITKVFSLLATIFSIISVIMFFLSYILFHQLEKLFGNYSELPNPSINIMKLFCLLVTIIIVVVACILSMSLDCRKLLAPMILFFVVMIILSVLYYFSDSVWTMVSSRSGDKMLIATSISNNIHQFMVNPFLSLAKIFFYVMVGTTFAADRK